MSKFVKVVCNKCNNEQVIFSRPSSTIKCLICDQVLAKPTGGKGDFKVEIVEEFD